MTAAAILARWSRAFLLPALAMGLPAACAPRRVAERLVLGTAVARSPGIAYGGGREGLDVYRPTDRRSPAPVIVFLHGGRWQSGSKNDYVLLANTFARRGWVVVVPDYHKYPDVVFPGWVVDGASAVRWTTDNVARFGGDPSRIFVVGHSSGGHTTAILALDTTYLRRAGVPASGVQGFVSLAGPVDTTWTDPDVQVLMGPASEWTATYPRSHVGGATPPLLLLHGSGDETVGDGNSVRLTALVRARGGCARAVVYRGVGHIEIVAALALPTGVGTRVLSDLTRFIRDPVRDACSTALRAGASPPRAR